MSESVALAEKIKYSAEVTAQDCVTLNFFHSSFFLVSSFYFNLILFFGILEFQRTKKPHISVLYSNWDGERHRNGMGLLDCGCI